MARDDKQNKKINPDPKKGPAPSANKRNEQKTRVKEEIKKPNSRQK